MTMIGISGLDTVILAKFLADRAAFMEAEEMWASGGLGKTMGAGGGWTAGCGVQYSGAFSPCWDACTSPRPHVGGAQVTVKATK
jgi:hypothetical protein